MNATNRGLNRVVLIIVGVILLGAGAFTVTAALWPAAREAWESALSNATVWTSKVYSSSQGAAMTEESWFVIVAVAVAVVLIVLSIVVMARLGGGRSHVMTRIEAREQPHGSVTIQQGFASEAITHSLAGREELLTSRVESRKFGGTEVLHIAVTPRQNTSPTGVVEAVTTLVDNLGLLTGNTTPALVSIHSGIRARISADQPRVN